MLDYNLSLVFGQFGAWKTYYIIREAKKAYERGDIVISNTWLSFPHIRFYVPADLPPILEEINEYHHHVTTPSVAPLSYLEAHSIPVEDEETRNFFVVLDEAGIFFNSRNYQKNFSDPSFLEMFTQPRKYGMQICAICQDLGMVDKNIRNLAQEVVEFSPFLFGLLRRAYSYDKKYIQIEGGWSPEIPLLDSKTYWHFIQRWKDSHKYFGWLYYTREILGHKAIHHDTDIRTLKRYFEIENLQNIEYSVDSESPITNTDIVWEVEQGRIWGIFS